MTRKLLSIVAVFHVTVQVAEAATNQAKAIELARRIAAEP